MPDTIIMPPEEGASASSRMELKEDTTVIVLGASGDLAKKKTFPALFGLFRNRFLPSGVHIVGYARTKMDREEFLKRVKSNIKTPNKDYEESLDEFAKHCSYISGQYDKDEGFQELEKHLAELEKDQKKAHRVFYMALPPSVFIPVSEHLKKWCYPTTGIARLIVEKPFGKDLQSSRELQRALKPNWKEEEIFRIDHYLGKEMVKNILVLRFGNSFFSAGWDRYHVDNVQITFKEPFGTEGRGGYFDEFGIIRDVMQNHLLQILTLLAMDRPISFSAEDIRDEKVRVLKAIPSIKPNDVIIGQYGKSLDGSKPRYKEDDTVPKDSRCPTFASMVCYVKNERWDGVPFILKAGKALNEQKTEVRIQLKDVTSGIFKDIPRNELVIRVQPNESVYIKMNSKQPGLSMQTVMTELDLTYRRRFSDLKIPEAYESLILDAFKGDHSNFVRDDELDSSWRIFTPLLHYLDENTEIQPMEYPYGSRGPAVLDDFTASYGYRFFDNAGYVASLYRSPVLIPRHPEHIPLRRASRSFLPLDGANDVKVSLSVGLWSPPTVEAVGRSDAADVSPLSISATTKILHPLHNYPIAPISLSKPGYDFFVEAGDVSSKSIPTPTTVSTPASTVFPFFTLRPSSRSSLHSSSTSASSIEITLAYEKSTDAPGH